MVSTAQIIFPTPKPSSSHGLEKSAKIGVGVGVSIGGVLLLSAIAFILIFLKRIKKHRQVRNGDEHGAFEKPELSGEGGIRSKLEEAPDVGPVFEIEDTSSPVEIEEGYKWYYRIWKWLPVSLMAKGEVPLR